MAKGNDVGDMDAPKKKSKLLVVIILVLSVVVLGGGGYFAYLKFFKAQTTSAEEQTPSNVESGSASNPDVKTSAAKEEKKNDKKSGSKKDDKVAPVTSIHNIVTNLADPGGKRYIRISVQFEFKTDEVAHDFSDKFQTRVKDAILTLLWSKTSEALSGVDGMSLLREDIKSRVNQIMGPGSVTQVFILDRVIQ